MPVLRPFAAIALTLALGHPVAAQPIDATAIIDAQSAPPEERAALVEELLAKARAAQADHRPDDAVELLDHALLLDPWNGTARMLRRVLAGDPATSLEDARTMQLMTGTTIECDLAGVTLDQVATYLRLAAKVEVLVDWRSLERDGIGRHDTITLRRPDAPASQVLDELLAGVGRAVDLVAGAAGAADAAKRTDPPRWEIAHGTVCIASGDAIRPRRVTRVYDVRDFVEPSIQAVVDRIVATVAPRSWQETGGDAGDRGTIRPVGRNLVITTTPWVHRHVAALLTRLRAATPAVRDRD